MDPARVQDATRRAVAAASVALALGVLTACGSNGGDPQPPVPTVVTASISGDRVSISPGTFASGPISLIVTNRTGAAQQVTIESSASPHGEGALRQQTAPISPRDTATLLAEVLPGDYTVTVGGHRIAPATLRVGRARDSA